MKKTIGITILIIMAFFAITMGKQGVTFSEMEKPPVISIQENGIAMQVFNSVQNASKTIYRIDFEQEGKSLVFSGFQRLVFGKMQHDYFFSYKQLTIQSLAGFQYFWKDPDGKTWPLTIDLGK